MTYAVEADAAEEREHDRRGADQHRVDAEALGQAGADTAEPAAVGVASVAAAAQSGEAVVEEGRALWGHALGWVLRHGSSVVRGEGARHEGRP